MGAITYNAVHTAIPAAPRMVRQPTEPWFVGRPKRMESYERTNSCGLLIPHRVHHAASLRSQERKS